MANDPPRLVLASSSPRRRELLGRFKIPFDVIESGVDENVPAGLTTRQIVLHLSQLKARAVAAIVDSAPGETLILGADTAIDLDGSMLGKPQHPEDARRMLSCLRGRGHQVITGLTLIREPVGRFLSGAVTTTVWMKGFSNSQCDAYLASGEPMGKAGSYAIQGLGGDLVERISGCYNNVVGLPLCEAARLAEELFERRFLDGAVCDLPTGERCPRLG